MSPDSTDISQPAPWPSGAVAIVAAYNEAPRIEATLSALAATFPGAPLWVADDGSTDATAQIAGRAGARVVRSERTIGKGGAVTLAARKALEDARNVSSAIGGARDDEPIFILCDGDLAGSACSLDALVDVVRRGDTDMAVAAFATRVGGGVGLAVGFARWAIRRRCGLELRAPISGQRALRASVLEDVLPFARGFGMEIGMTIDAARSGHRIAEIELPLSHRATGRTLAGFLHRGRQLVDFVRVYLAR
jgi:glycosyltransferase involved in cell wall biosynthesis